MSTARAASHPRSQKASQGCPPSRQANLDPATRQVRSPGTILDLDLTDAATVRRRAELPGQGHVLAALVRLSVGCEHVEDLYSGLATALDGLSA